jgi:hypothetical protein
VQFIEINAASYGEEVFEFTPSEPLPESELMRITFSKNWLLENENRNPGQLKSPFRHRGLRSTHLLPQIRKALHLPSQPTC